MKYSYQKLHSPQNLIHRSKCSSQEAQGTEEHVKQHRRHAVSEIKWLPASVIGFHVAQWFATVCVHFTCLGIPSLKDIRVVPSHSLLCMILL